MRTLLAAAAALIAVGAASPSYAAPISLAAPMTSTLVRTLPATSALDGAVVYKSTRKKKKSSESASFEEIGSAKRGKSDLEIKVKVSKADRTCELKITWNNDDKFEDDTDSNDDKICEFSVEVPNDKNVVGDATAEVTVKNADGKKVASAKKTINVK